MSAFFYVYILECVSDPQRHYIGFTADLKERLREHNAGTSPYTAKYAPWRLKTYVAFRDQTAALDFERYLKSGSGRAFAKKRL